MPRWTRGTRASLRHPPLPAIAGVCAGLCCALLGGAGCERVEPAPRAAATPEPRADAPSEQEAEQPVVLFLGTSLTAGRGLPAHQAFPALIQQRIDEAGLDYRVVNAGVSGDTSAGGLRRLDWLLRAPVAVLVLELGANDMLRGQGPEELGRNLQEILRRTSAAHPDARLLVAGMRAPPNLGPDYVRRFEAVYPDLAERHGAALLPFLLEGVAGDPSLNQPDGIHPTAAGHRRIADNVWEALEPLL